MKKILFVTSNNFSTNPRLLKEVKLASSHSFNVTVLFFEIRNWSSYFDSQIQSELEGIDFIRLKAGKNNFLLWVFISSLEKILRKFPIKYLSPKLVSLALSKKSYLIQHALGKINCKYDFIIAHNPAAFFPSAYFSIQTNTKLGIDIEDYHPGESTNKTLKKINEKLIEYSIPKADYVSFASPLYVEPVKVIVGNHKMNEVVLLNGFKASEFLCEKKIVAGKLKLVWYSQNISFNRGLEFVIDNLKKCASQIELHLIGSLNLEFYSSYISGFDFIYIHEPMEQKKLHNYLSNFDIGLAADLPVDVNRDLAITNKIISYAQAGLYILASETSGHKYFIEKYRLQAVKYSYAKESFDLEIQSLLSKIEHIRMSRETRLIAGKQFNWDLISLGLIHKWRE